MLGSGGGSCGEYEKLLHHGGLAATDKQGRVVEQCNASTPFIPASVLKIATSLAVLNILGEGYRFATEFYFDDTRTLTIKGFGDPLLISEEVALIVTELGKRGVSDVARIVVDDSAFALEGPVPGAAGSDNPYDALTGAVAVNFNTVAVRVDGKGGVISAEEQTPTVPLMASLGKGYPPGEYRLNICRTEEKSAEVMVRYTAELFFAFLRQKGMTTSSRWERGRKRAEARLVYRHESTKSLSGVVALCLQYSNNFTANLLFLAAGGERFGYPATWEKGRRAVNETLTELLGDEVMGGIHLVEGSGLSRENRLSVEALLEVLRLFKPHAHLLPGKRGMLIKSGTMRDVYGYAGYLDQGESAFVILLNQPENTRDALLDRIRSRSRLKDH